MDPLPLLWRPAGRRETRKGNCDTTIREPTAPKLFRHPLRANGNVFAIVGHVRKALKNAGLHDRASEFVRLAFHTGPCHNVLRLRFE